MTVIAFSLVTALFIVAIVVGAIQMRRQRDRERDALVTSARAKRRLAVEHAVAAALADARTLEVATPRILEEVCSLLAWEWGAVWSVDEEADVLRYVASWHVPDRPHPEFAATSRERTFAPGIGLPGRVWQRGVPVWIADVVADDNFPRAAIAACEGLHGAFAFPVLRAGAVLGVVEFFSSAVREPDESMLETFTTVGSQIGQFLERTRSEERLRAREQDLADFVENASVGIHRVAGDGTILQANRAELEMLGYAADEYVGRRIADFHVDRACIDDILCRLNAGETLRDCEARLRRKDGAVRDVVINSNVRWDHGRFVHTRCFTRDVTDQKQAEAEHARLLEREQAARAIAEAANRAKDEFLATVSHELRAPLTPLILWARMLRGGMLDAAATERALEVIETNAKAQAQLVEDLLDVSRIVTGRLRLDVVPVALRAVVAAALESMRPAAEAKGVEVTTALHADADVVSGDAGRLQQVVWNLLSNAVKFTPRGGRVELSLVNVDAEIEITVRDTGKGIDPAFLPFVFDRFQQADGAPSRMYGGFGLGLAIVRHLVELHGGTVHVDSAGEDLGATFVVRLPRLVHAASAASPRDAFGGRLRGLRLVVVDDDVDTCQAIGAVLRRAGAEVRLAESAAEAMDVLAGWRPDVLVSDVGLPGEDGYDLVRRIRALPAGQGNDIPAVALTGYARAEDRMRGLAAGFQRHVVKPVEPAELVDVVASVATDRDAVGTMGAVGSAGAASTVGAAPTVAGLGAATAAAGGDAASPRRDRAAISDAVAFVSHELRQPLAAMRIWLNLLEADLGEALTEESRDHLEQIRASVTWMGELIAGRLADPDEPSDPTA